MPRFLEIAQTGLVAILLHPLRSLVTTACLLAMLVPYLVGLGLSKGIQRQAEDAIHFGADIYVCAVRFGRRVPVPLSSVTAIREIEGTTEVVPRIVGRIVLGKQREEAILVGIPVEKLPTSTTCVQGRLFGSSSPNELVVGTELARRLKLEVGAVIPPFYRSATGERISKVVGLFKSDVSLWESRLVFTSFETAAHVFDEPDLATDLLVYCRPGYEKSVSSAISKTVSFPTADADRSVRPRVIGRQELQAMISRGLLHREGIFNLHFVLAFVVGILAILVTSGFGLSERRREIGILKATGWQTDEILLRSLAESVLLSLTGASAAILLAFVWLRWLNGYGIASIFLPGVAAMPSFTVPFHLTPIPALFSFLISLVVVMSGTVYSSWRSATVAPVEAMR
jgi:ABC-type lipoprotein release transport system permease subunit